MNKGGMTYSRLKFENGCTNFDKTPQEVERRLWVCNFLSTTMKIFVKTVVLYFKYVLGFESLLHCF